PSMMTERERSRARGLDDQREAIGEVKVAVLAGDDAEAVVLDLVQPRLAARHRWGQRWGLIGYSFDKRVVRQVFVVLSYNGFCFPQRSKPPLNLQIFISSNAFYNSTLFYEQLEFSWLIHVSGVGFNFCNLGCEIDASGSDPILFYDALVRSMRMMQERRKSSWK